MTKNVYKLLFVFLFVFISNISKAEENLETILKKTNQKEEVENTGIYKNIKRPNGVGIVNNDGKVIFKGDYDDIKSLDIEIDVSNSIHNKFFTFSLNGKEGLIDETARIIVKPKYDKIADVFPDKDSYCFKFVQNNKLGIFDFYGKEILSPNYDHIEPVRNNNEIKSFFVGNKGIYSLFSKKTKKLVLTNLMDFKSIGFNLFKITIKNKSGVIDSNGRFIIKPIYDDIGILDDSDFIFYKKKNKLGIISLNGKIITNALYDDIELVFRSKLIKYRIGNKYGIINQNLQVKQNAIFDEIGYPHNFNRFTFCKRVDRYKQNQPIRINNKWGFVDYLGNIIINPKFDYILNFYHNLGYVGMKNTKNFSKKGKSSNSRSSREYYNKLLEYKWGVINNSGNWVIKPEFDFIREFSEGLALAKKGKTTGYINKSGIFVIKKDISFIYSYKDEHSCEYYFENNFVSIYTSKGYYQLIDKSGKEYFKHYKLKDFIRPLHSSPERDKKTKYTEKDFTLPSKLVFYKAFSLNKDLYYIRYNGFSGLADSNNNFIIKPLYKDFEIIKNKYNNKNYYIFLSDNNGNSKIFDENLKLILDYKFDRINENGVGFTIDSEDKLGLLDKNFNVLVKPTFSRIGNFNNSIAYVSITGNYSYINEKGQLLLDLKYKNTDDYCGDVAWVQDGNNYLLISKKQDIILKDIINHENFENKLSIFYDTDKYILTDKNNKILFNKQIEDISILYDNRYKDEDNGKKYDNKIVFLIKENENNYYIVNEKLELIHKNSFHLVNKYNVKFNNLFGRIDEDGKYIVKPIYENIYYVDDNLYAFKLNNKWGFMDSNNNILVNPIYDEIETFYKLCVKLGEKWTFLDERFLPVTKPIFDEKPNFYRLNNIYSSETVNNFFAIVKVNDKYGVINENGDFVISPIYDSIKFDDRLHEGILKVNLNDKIGYFSRTGKELFKPIIEDEYLVHDKLFVININNKKGIIDKNFKIILEPIYDDITSNYVSFYPNKEDLPKIILNNKYGLIDKEGKIIVPPKYDYIDEFRNGFAQVKIVNKLGFIDKKGKEIVKPYYDYISGYYLNNLKKGYANVSLNNKWGIIDENGHELIKPKYQKIGDIEYGLITAKLNNKWGIIDKKDNIIIDFKYDSTTILESNLFEICLFNKYYLINKKGKKLTIGFDDFFSSFTEGLTQVKLNGKFGFINRKGELVIKPIYDNDYVNFSEGLVVVAKSNKYGFIDKKGRIIIDFIYDNASNFIDGKAEVSQYGDWFYIDKKGKKIKLE